ncbi:MAG: M24 family metallopeptidase [bacterium]
MDIYRNIRESLSRKRLDGFLITDLLNIKYLTSFSGSSAALFIGRESIVFFTDFRYQYECEQLLTREELVIVRGDFLDGIRKHLKSRGARKLGFEYGASYQAYDRLRSSFQLMSLKNTVERFRIRKEREELRHIRTATKRAEHAFLESRKWIRAGTTERKVALVLEDHLKKAGCRKAPFDIIVASGRNAALPHARASEKKIEHGDLVVIDWGGEAEGYMADMTRTVLLRGSDLGIKKRIYDIVLKANRRALESVRPGLACRDIDGTARAVIEQEGYGDFFGHGTGHGVGLNVHESPSISPRSKEVVAPGMVFTIEPGIYLPDIGGVRIEDMIAVEKDRGRLLTALPKGLEIL